MTKDIAAGRQRGVNDTHAELRKTIVVDRHRPSAGVLIDAFEIR